MALFELFALHAPTILEAQRSCFEHQSKFHHLFVLLKNNEREIIVLFVFCQEKSPIKGKFFYEWPSCLPSKEL